MDIVVEFFSGLIMGLLIGMAIGIGAALLYGIAVSMQERH
jgi:hypothetical protein